MSVSLFGLEFPLRSDGTLDLAPLASHVDRIKLDGTRQAIVVGDVLTFIQTFFFGTVPGLEVTVEVNVALQLRDDGGVQVPFQVTGSRASAFRVFQTVRGTQQAIHLELGPILVDGTMAQGQPPFVLPPDNHAIVPARADTAPLSVSTREVAFGLDIPTKQLRFARGAFELRAGAGPNSSRWLSHLSRPTKVPLHRRIKTLTLEFDPIPGAALPLHAEHISPSSPLVALAAVENYSLEILLNAGASPTRSPLITSIKAKGNPLALTTYRYGTQDDRPMRWTTKEALELDVRAGAGRPTSLVISRHASGTRLVPVVRTLHGLAPYTQVQTLGDNIELAVDDSDGWVSLNSGGTLDVAKAGLAHTLDDGTSKVETLGFAGKLRLPLLPTSLASPTMKGKLAKSFAGLTSPFNSTRHETGLIERADPVTIATFSTSFLPHETVPQDPTPVSLDKRVLTLDFGIVVLKLEVAPTTNLDVIPLTVEQLRAALAGATPKLPLSQVGSAVCDFANREKDALAAIVKLDDRQKLSDNKLLNTAFIRDVVDATEKKVANQLDAVLDDPAWRGLILLDVPLLIENDETLKRVLNQTLSLAYVAITPRGASGGVSVFGRLLWKPGERSRPVCPADGPEVAYQLRSVDARWRDSQLLSFQTESVLTFDSFFGIKNPGHPTTLSLLGSYDASAQSFRFAGTFREPMSVFPPGGTFGPIEDVLLDSVEVRARAGSIAAVLDGRLTLRDFAGKSTPGNAAPTFKPDQDAATVEFRDLAIYLPAIGADMPWVGIDYPSFRLRVNKPVFKLGPFGLTLRSVGVGWLDGQPVARSVDTDHSTTDNEKHRTIGPRAFLIGLRLELMKLPELATDPSRQLTIDFDLRFGVEKGRWDPNRFELRIEGASATDIQIDLLRFLRLHIEKMEIEDHGGVQMLRFRGVSLEILGVHIIDDRRDDLDLYVFSQGGERTGVLLYAKRDLELGGILKINWLLIGRGVDVSEKTGNALLSPATDCEDPNRPPHEGLQRSFDNVVSKTPSKAAIDATFAPEQGWVFGMSVTVLGGAFSGKFLIQDRGYCGGTLCGTVFRDWFGLDTGISIAYVKKPRPDEDEFHVAMAMPKITMGAFKFDGGVVAVHLALNGGFLLDGGFPWLSNGTRQWERAIGAIVPPFQASGGFYIQYLKSHSAEGAECYEVGGGLALQLGLGVAAGGGWFRVWATIGIFAVLEGKLHLHKAQINGLFLRGSIGLLGRAAGELNLWVISLRVEVFLSAEADVTLLTGVYTKELPCGSEVDGARPQLAFDFDVVAGIAAQACIGGGLFKLCMPVRASVHIHCSHTITL